MEGAGFSKKKTMPGARYWVK